MNLLRLRTCNSLNPYCGKLWGDPAGHLSPFSAVTMNVVLYPFLFGVIALCSAWLWALTLPDTVTIRKRMEFDVPLTALWEVYTDPATQPFWRSNLARVEMLWAKSPKTWKEISRHGQTILFTERFIQEPERYVLDFQLGSQTRGCYEAAFTQAEGKTVGIFKEQVTVSGALPKILFRIFVNLAQEIETYGREAEVEARRRLSQEISSP